MARSVLQRTCLAWFVQLSLLSRANPAKARAINATRDAHGCLQQWD
jgi:hypothetical protein